MKRTQLSIKTSPIGGCKFHVYRSTSQEGLPADLNELKKLTPIMVISEDQLEKTAEMMEEIIEPDLRKVPMNSLVPYGLSFEPLRNLIHYFELEMEHVNANSGDVPEVNKHIVTVIFDSSGAIVKVTKLTENGNEDITSQDAIKFAETTVFIKEDLVRGAQYIKGRYFMKVISATDDVIQEDGVEYNGPVATGLTDPELAIQIVMQQITTNTSIPTLKIQPSKKEDGIVYYYRLVAEDSLGNLSDPSGLISSYVDQEESELRFQIETSNGDGIWKSIGTFKHLEVIDFGIPGTVMETAFGTCIANEVRAFRPSEIIPETANVISDNQVGLTIPNVFSDSDPTFRERILKKFRSRAIDSYGMTSEWSDESDLQNMEITIDQVVVLRKTVTGYPEDQRLIPIQLDDQNATQTVKWIRRYGRFYISLEHQTAPLNVRVSNSPVVVFDDETSFPTLTGIDGDILIGEMYNYTFYVFDAFGEVSTPTSIVVTT